MCACVHACVCVHTRMHACACMRMRACVCVHTRVCVTPHQRYHYYFMTYLQIRLTLSVCSSSVVAHSIVLIFQTFTRPSPPLHTATTIQYHRLNINIRDFSWGQRGHFAPSENGLPPELSPMIKYLNNLLCVLYGQKSQFASPKLKNPSSLSRLTVVSHRAKKKQAYATNE